MSSEYNLNTNLNANEDSRNKIRDLIVKVFRWIPRKVRIVLAILSVALLIIIGLNAFKPQAEKRAIPETVVSVDTITAKKTQYPIIVSANGTIQAETRGNLVAQVRGEIVATADNFKTGGSFRKGDVLIEIDPRDYRAERSRALANLSQAESNLSRERANAKQAEQDWKRLGNTTPAPDLVLRKPQLTAARAQFDSARAALDTANLNLSRTQITAPYDGRIIQRRAVLGQYVGVGTPIAEVFATEGVEVRLPISQEEFSQLGLDRFGIDEAQSYQVELSSKIGSKEYVWNAKVSRTDSTFDINTRQIDVIAVVEDAFGHQSGQPPLKIGQFVSAKILGRSVEDVFVIPNKSIREGRYVYVVRDGKLAKQSIETLWQDDENALIATGINMGERVVTTSLNSTLAGATAKLTDSATSSPALATATQKAEPDQAEANDAQSQDQSKDKSKDQSKNEPEQDQADAQPAAAGAGNQTNANTQ